MTVPTARAGASASSELRNQRPRGDRWFAQDSAWDWQLRGPCEEAGFSLDIPRDRELTTYWRRSPAAWEFTVLCWASVPQRAGGPAKGKSVGVTLLANFPA